ncbi:hypothetical protein Fot_32018 [Forsythia ovata]|uniref:Uncharacterized protein n=1 Tax=Forsythia ovata TaxID=205694 RepID=A0ABD1T6L3_9LAMI
MVDSPSFVLLAPEVISKVPSTSFFSGHVPSLESARQLIKRKSGANSGEEAFWAPTPPSHPPGRYEYVNIGSRRNKLDPTVLEKLPHPAAIAAASVHKYWTSTFGRAADNVELTELLKLAEMYTSRSHVLNCELYKLLEMKIDELRTTTGGDEDVEALRAENKDLREQLVFSEDARARAIYDVAKAERIQGVCVQAQKKAESQLRSCQNVVHAKDKELTEALSELSRARDLLANIGVPDYVDLQGPTGT